MTVKMVCYTCYAALAYSFISISPKIRNYHPIHD